LCLELQGVGDTAGRTALVGPLREEPDFGRIECELIGYTTQEIPFGLGYMNVSMRTSRVGRLLLNM
jgi:hypothetical protein